jgi:hypothetical protein
MFQVMGGIKFDSPKQLVLSVSLYSENFAIASIFQYFTVASFMFICQQFMDEAMKKAAKSLDEAKSTDEESRKRKEELDQWHKAFPKIGFMGVISFIVVGVLKQVIFFGLDFVGAHPQSILGNSTIPETFDTMQEELNDKLGVVTAFATLLCIINMNRVCEVPAIREHLRSKSVAADNNKEPRRFGSKLKRSPSFKFWPLETLLLLVEVQKFLLYGKEAWVSRMFSISDIQGMLLHSTFLTYECLILVLFNLYAWSYDINMAQLLLFRRSRPINTNKN